MIGLVNQPPVIRFTPESPIGSLTKEDIPELDIIGRLAKQNRRIDQVLTIVESLVNKSPSTQRDQQAKFDNTKKPGKKKRRKNNSGCPPPSRTEIAGSNSTAATAWGPVSRCKAIYSTSSTLWSPITWHPTPGQPPTPAPSPHLDDFPPPGEQ